jgi:AcrR family transcriptional regulator
VSEREQEPQERQHQEQRPGLRSDAERNRARILEVARTALTGSRDVTLNSIARQSGVGQGTLYRHFPNREALLLAVYRYDVRELIDAAPALLAAHPPLEALRLWLDRLGSYGRIKQGVADAVAAATRADLSSEYYGEVTGAITALLDAGKQAGAVRPDVDAGEVLHLVGFLWHAGDGNGWDARAQHLLDLVMDGLRSRPGASP